MQDGEDVVGMVLVKVEPEGNSVERVLFGSPRRREVKQAEEEVMLDDLEEVILEETEEVIPKVAEEVIPEATAEVIPELAEEVVLMALKQVIPEPKKELIQKSQDEAKAIQATETRDSAIETNRVLFIDKGHQTTLGSTSRDMATSPLKHVYYSSLVSYLDDSAGLPRLDKSPIRGRSISPVSRKASPGVKSVKVPDLISWSPEQLKADEVVERRIPPRRASPRIIERKSGEVEKRRSPVRRIEERKDEDELFDVRWLEKKRVSQARVWKDGRVFDQEKKEVVVKKVEVGKSGIDYRTTREDLDRLMRIYKTDN